MSAKVPSAPPERPDCRSAGFTLIELLIVMVIIGLTLTLASPRLAAFFDRPEDRELTDLEHFMLQSARTAIRKADLPLAREGELPLRMKLIPPDAMVLMVADTEISRFDFKIHRIAKVEEDGRAVAGEPELPLTNLGLVSPFSMQLTRSPNTILWWRINRLGDIRVEEGP